MDKVIVLAYDLGAVLIILMTMARSAQKGFATGHLSAGRAPGCLLWRAVCGKGRGKHHLRQLFKD